MPMANDDVSTTRSLSLSVSLVVLRDTELDAQVKDHIDGGGSVKYSWGRARRLRSRFEVRICVVVESSFFFPLSVVPIAQ